MLLMKLRFLAHCCCISFLFAGPTLSHNVTTDIATVKRLFDRLEKTTSPLENENSCFHFSCLNALRARESYYFCKSDGSNSSSMSELLREQLNRVDSDEEMSRFLTQSVNSKLRVYTSEDGMVEDESYPILSGFKAICRACKCARSKIITTVKFAVKYRVLFIMMGVLALFGNGVLIPTQAYMLFRKRSIEKEGRIYSILLLNLSCADFLMGIYVTVFSLQKSYDNYSFDFNLCNALGVISITSNQVSVSILVMISACRVYGVLYPYRRVHFKPIVILLSFVWLFWIAVAILPILDYRVFSFSFSRAVKIIEHANNSKAVTIRFPRIAALFNTLSKHESKLPTDFAQLVKTITHFKSNKVLFDVIKSFKIANISEKNWDVIGYFVPGTACTVDFLVASRHEYKAYVLTLLLFNLTSFVFIFATCIIILKQVATTKQIFSCMNNKNQAATNLNERQKDSENQKIIHKLMLIVITDFVCWVPICGLALFYFVQSNLTAECDFCIFNNLRRWVAIVVLILIPVNSVLNPFIYSINIWSEVVRFFKKFEVAQSGNTQSTSSPS